MSTGHRALTQSPAETPTYRLGIIAGRLAAFCVHPFAAWPVLSIGWRMAVLTTYAASAFFIVLSALLLTA